MTTTVEEQRDDRLTRWDAHVWRGPCGGWHYIDHACRVCTLLARRERES